jgi:hypothetical protein
LLKTGFFRQVRELKIQRKNLGHRYPNWYPTRFLKKSQFFERNPIRYNRWFFIPVSKCKPEKSIVWNGAKWENQQQNMQSFKFHCT